MEQNLSSSNRGSTNMSAACNTQGMYILIVTVAQIASGLCQTAEDFIFGLKKFREIDLFEFTSFFLA